MRTLIIIIMLSLAVPALALDIEVNNVRQNDTDQTVYMTIMDDAGAIYKWHGDIPKGVDPAKWIEAHKEQYLAGIRQKEYPGAGIKFRDDETRLQAFERWISEGRINQVVIGEDDQGDPIIKERVIDKVPFKGTHPPVLEVKEQLKTARTVEERLAILEQYLGLK